MRTPQSGRSETPSSLALRPSSLPSCDALIVGGGPAGSTCAWALRRAGWRVIVCDRRRFPRDKICAGWITPQVLAEIELEPRAYAAEGRTIQPITGFRVSRLGDREACVRYGRPVSYAIRRCEFDDFLLRRSGAELRLGEPLRSLRRSDGAWVLNDTVRAGVLVGAGGHFCPVAQHLGARLGAGEPIVAAQEAEFELTAEEQRDCDVEADVPELFFARDLKGYGWVVRKGAYLNVGLGRQDSRAIGSHVEALLDFLRGRGKIPAGRDVRPRGHAYLLHGEASRPLGGPAALLVGDAAGLAYPKSGEGIRPAIESGLLAAETIVAARGRYDASFLAAYEERLGARFGARRAGWGITDVVPAPVAAAVAARLFAAPWFARRVVLERWFFHVEQQALAPPGLAGASAPADLALHGT
jgi:geranylgeranyl reductase family protein